MTDPLQSYDVELLKRYDAELQEIETLPPAAIELSAYQALALITHIQLAAANPAVEHNPLLPSAIAAAKQIQSNFNPNSAIHEVLNLCWQEPQDSDKLSLTQFLLARPADQKSSDQHHLSQTTTPISKRI